MKTVGSHLDVVKERLVDIKVCYFRRPIIHLQIEIRI